MSRGAKLTTRSQSGLSPAAILGFIISTSTSTSDAFSAYYKSAFIRPSYGDLRIRPPTTQIAIFSRCHPSVITARCRPRLQTPCLRSKIIDAEVIPDDNDIDPPLDDDIPASNLVEYSQNLDPDWKSMPVAFCDAVSNTYVDCNLAFYVKDPSSGEGGAEYALGVPCEIPIVVALETEDDDGGGGGGGATTTADDDGVVNLLKVVPINPDVDEGGGEGGGALMREEEKEEVFQLAARALIDEYGPSMRLKKTPRVLTLEGDLDGVLGDWREVLLGGSGGKKGDKAELSIEDALKVYDDEDENDKGDFFDRIMRRDLGEDYESLVDDDDDDMDEELLKLFRDDSSPSGGSDDDDDDDVDELINDLDDISDRQERFKDSGYDALVRRLQPSAALKLLNFLGPGGREYTILRPLRPILLVGREDPNDYTRRILLTEEERRILLPRLESACREGLEEAGFFLSGS